MCGRQYRKVHPSGITGIRNVVPVWYYVYPSEGILRLSHSCYKSSPPECGVFFVWRSYERTQFKIHHEGRYHSGSLLRNDYAHRSDCLRRKPGENIRSAQRIGLLYPGSDSGTVCRMHSGKSLKSVWNH